jgi:hypothetical protein
MEKAPLEELKARLAKRAEEKKTSKSSQTLTFVIGEVKTYTVLEIKPGKFGTPSVRVKTDEGSAYLPGSLIKGATFDGVEFIAGGIYGSLFAGTKDTGQANPMKVFVTERLK